MNLDLRPFLALWVLLAGTVIFLLAWRKMVSRNEDDSLHVMQEASVSNQTAVSHKLDVIDKWGKTLTVITVVVGLLVAAAYVYQNWVQAAQIPTGA